MKEFFERYYQFTALLVVLTAALLVFGRSNTEVVTTIIIGAFLGVLTAPSKGSKEDK